MSAPVTEAHKQLAYAILFAYEDGPAGPNEAAQLIADSEALAVTEIAMVAAASADRNVSLRLERDQLRAELATCKDASEALVESLRAEVERLRDGGVQRIKDAMAVVMDERDSFKARAERAEAEVKKLTGFYNEIVVECGHDRIVREYRQRGELLRDEANRRKEAEAELATERAKYNQLLSALVYADQILDDIDTCSDAHKPMYSSYSQNVFKLCIKGRDARRAAIDAAVKEGA